MVYFQSRGYKSEERIVFIMNSEYTEKPILVWVTNPAACKRIIAAGRKIADEHRSELYIVSIQNKILDDWEKRAKDLELLHRAAREANADLTVVYSENAFQSATEVVSNIAPQVMIAGRPGTEGRSAFLEHLFGMREDIQTYVIDGMGNLVRADILRRL